MTRPRAACSYVALLRGVNVGGKHKMPMKDLVQVFAACECGEPRSYIQSGNVVFTSRMAAKDLRTALEERISQHFGFAAPVVLRTAEQMAGVVATNPFVKAGKSSETLYVSFLADQPTAAAVSSLDPDRSPPDEFRVIGSEIYFHLPNGMGKSKLTSAYFDSRLKTVGTARNWNTVLRLAEMAQQATAL